MNLLQKDSLIKIIIASTLLVLLTVMIIKELRFVINAYHISFEDIAREKLDETVNSLDSLFVETKILSEYILSDLSEYTDLNDRVVKKIMKRHYPYNLADGLLLTIESPDDNNYAFILKTEENKQEFIDILQYPNKLYNYLYTKTISKNESWWSETLFDSILGTRIVAFSIPFTSPEKKRQGALSFIFTMSHLYQNLQNFGLGRYGFPYIMDSATHFIAHPLDEIRSLGDLGRDYYDEVLIDLENDLLLKRTNILEKNYIHKNTVTLKDCNEVFCKLNESPWFVGLSIYDGFSLESGEYRKEMRQSCIRVIIYLTLFLLSISVVFFGQSTAKFLYFAYPCLSFIVIILIINIYNRFPDSQIQKEDVLLSKNIDTDQSGLLLNEYHKIYKWDPARITDMESLNTFIDIHSVESEKLYNEPLKTIPTGFYLYGVKFLSSYEIKITGCYWQKFLASEIDYPVSILNKYHDDAYEKKGCVFPGAEVIENTVIDSLNIFLENYPGKLYRWNFDIEISQDLSYALYPFGRNDIKLPIWSVNFDDNTLLTPDLESYKQLYPDVCPGLGNNFMINGWNILNSYYSYNLESYLCNFGNYNIYGINRFPELQFNISVSRKFIDILICKIIPILIVLILLFTILFVREDDDGFNNIIGCSSLFFVLVLDHINLRESIVSENIMFLEYCYFFTYLLLLLITITSFEIENDSPINKYSEFLDLFLRKYYWSTITGLMAMVTAFVFY